jgi:hypothetical protein
LLLRTGQAIEEGLPVPALLFIEILNPDVSNKLSGQRLGLSDAHKPLFEFRIGDVPVGSCSPDKIRCFVANASVLGVIDDLVRLPLPDCGSAKPLGSTSKMFRPMVQ